MKKFLCILLAFAMLFALTACGEKTDNGENSNAVDQNLYGVSEDELIQKTGIDLPAPEGAENVSYNVIDPEAECPIAELVFSIDGKEMYLRAQATGLLPDRDENGEIQYSDSVDILEKTTGYDISGLYYEWDNAALTAVSYCTAYLYGPTDGAGFVAWLDIVPGILYNLCMANDADMELILNTANAAFVPMQGDS